MSVLYGIAGAVALACTTFMVHSLGAFQGATAGGSMTLGIAAVVVHLGGVMVFGIGTGREFRAGRKWRGMAGVMIVAGAAIFSLWNIAGFVIAHNQGVAKAQAQYDDAVVERRKATLDALEKRRQTQAELAKEELKWSRGTSREVDGRRERKDLAETRARLIAEMGKGVDQPSTIEPPPTVAVRPVAVAEMAARFIGLSPDTVMLLAALFMGLLLIVIEAVAWMRAGYYWSIDAAVEKPATPKTDDSSDGNTGGGGSDSNVIPLKPAEPSTPAIRAETAPGAVAATPVVELPKSATPQRSALPVAGAPWSDEDVDALLKQRPLMSVRPTWRQLGEMTGWDHTTLFKRGQRLMGKAGKRNVLGQRRQQHRHQEGNRAYA